MPDIRKPATSGREVRVSTKAEVRAADGKVSVVGHPAVFNQEANIAGCFREIIRPGAFSRAITQDDVPFLIEHEGLPLARNTAGTLKLSEDDIGLRMETDLLADDPDVMRIVPKMQRGDLSKMSFAFEALRQEWDETGDIPLRTIIECRLYDVSIVTMPAYEGTDIGLRSLDAWREERKRQNFNAAGRRLRLTKLHDLRFRRGASL